MFGEKIAKKFTEALVEETKIKLGNPMDDSTDIGPMASLSQFKNTINKVALAKKQGARVC